VFAEDGDRGHTDGDEQRQHDRVLACGQAVVPPKEVPKSSQDRSHGCALLVSAGYGITTRCSSTGPGKHSILSRRKGTRKGHVRPAFAASSPVPIMTCPAPLAAPAPAAARHWAEGSVRRNPGRPARALLPEGALSAATPLSAETSTASPSCSRRARRPIVLLHPPPTAPVTNRLSPPGGQGPRQSPPIPCTPVRSPAMARRGRGRDRPPARRSAESPANSPGQRGG
jgi:hypothetical protein